MNIIEYNLLLLAALSTFAYIVYVHTNKDIRFGIVAITIITPVLIFSIDKSISFLTVDETHIILESIDIRNSDMPWWNNMVIWRMGCLRTTDLIIGSVFSLLNSLLDFSKLANMNIMLAKAMHWYIGFLLILYIHYLLQKKYFLKKNANSNVILTICLLVLLPSNNFSLRIFNYDLLSMLLATIALLYLINAINEKSKKQAIYSIIFALFAAQEKINVSPILTLSIFIFTYYAYRESKNYRDRCLKRLPRLMVISSIGFALPLLLSLISYLIVGLFRGGNIPPLSGLADPIVGWTYPLMPKINLGYDLQAEAHGLDYGVHMTKSNINILFIFFIYIGNIIFIEIIRTAENLIKNKIDLGKVKKIIYRFKNKVVLILFVLVLIIGAIGLYSSEYLIGPIIEISKGYYKPPSFSGWYLHFGASNIISHTLQYTMYSYAIFCNGLPSMLILVLMYCLVKNGDKDNYKIYILAAGFLLIPLIYGVNLLPLNMRYINLSFMLFLIFTLYSLDRLKIKMKFRWFLSFLIILVVFMEVYPFYPIHGAFRPIWVKLPSSFNHTPLVGKMRVGAWKGWGEELMIAGKRIEKICMDKNRDCRKIRIYHSCPGAWNDAKLPIKTLHIQKNISHLRFTKDDFYVINRAAIAWGFIKDIDIEKIEHEFKIDYRNYTQAWIMRGDNLISPGSGLIKLLIDRESKKVEVRDAESDRIFFSVPYLY